MRALGKEGMSVSTPTPGASRSPGHPPPLPPPRWGCAPTPARPHLLPTSRGVPLDRSLAEGAHLPKLCSQRPREHGGRTYRPGERGTCTAPYPRTTSFPNTSGPYTLSTICGPSNDKAGVSPWGILGRAGQRAGPWSSKPLGVGLTENGLNVGTPTPHQGLLPPRIQEAGRAWQLSSTGQPRLGCCLIQLSTDPRNQQASRCDRVGSGPRTSFSEGALDSGQRGRFWEGWCAVRSRRTEGKQRPARPSCGILTVPSVPGGQSCPLEAQKRTPSTLGPSGGGSRWVGRGQTHMKCSWGGEGRSEIVTAFPTVSPPKQVFPARSFGSACVLNFVPWEWNSAVQISAFNFLDSVFTRCNQTMSPTGSARLGPI